MEKEEIFNVFYEKDKWKNYRRFQAIEFGIDDSGDLYRYFDEIKEMLSNNKSSIRVRGFRIICKLSKWDCENKINKNIDILMDELDDDKPTALRQCFNALDTLLVYKPELAMEIENKLRKINCLKYNENMAPLIKKDIGYLLERIRNIDKA